MVELEQYVVVRKTTIRTTPEIAAQRRDSSASLAWSRTIAGFSTAITGALRLGGRLRTAGDDTAKPVPQVSTTATEAVGAGREISLAIGWQQPGWSAELAQVQTAENKTARTRAKKSTAVRGEWLLGEAEKVQSLSLHRTSTIAEKIATSGFIYDAYTVDRTSAVYTRRLKSNAHLEFALIRGRTEYDRKTTATNEKKVVGWEWIRLGFTKEF